jgi:hypothetical protein
MNIQKIIVFVLTLACPLVWADREGSWINAKDGRIYKGNGPKLYRAIHQDNLCHPDLTPNELLNAIIRISTVGATNLSFTLDGFNADGTELDEAYLNAAIMIKDDTNYRWIDAICNVLGSLKEASHEVRLNAARTAGLALADHQSMLYVIEGNDSEDLVEAFKEAAPNCAVAAVYGGDIDLVPHPKFMTPDRPGLVMGMIPGDADWRLSSIIPDEPKSYERYASRTALAAEKEAVYNDPTGLTPQEIEEGFVMLYNGKDMNHWTITGRQDGFVSRGGNITWNRRGARRVLSKKRYGDFVLRLEYKIHFHNGNSGIFLRAPRANRESSMGMEFQIMGDYGEEPHKNSTGAIYDQIAATSNASNPEGTWNALEIQLDGSQLIANLNGIEIQNLDLFQYDTLRHRLRKGFIALQDHGDPVSFRRIRIKEL